MKFFKNSLLIITVLILSSISLIAQDKSQSSESHFLKSRQFSSIHWGGRIQLDMMFMQQNDSLDAHFTSANGIEIRRARFYTSGKVHNISFKLQIDFAHNALIVKDAWLNFSKIPFVGNFKVGNMKEPIGLNTLTSSKYLTFMERPITSDLDFDRKLGFMLHNQHFDKRLSWSAGIFYPSAPNNKYLGNAYHLTFRLSGLPIYNVEYGEYQVLHLGASFSNQYLYNSTLLFASRPESHLAPKYITINTNNIKSLNSVNFEAALILRSLSFQGEYHMFKFQPSDTIQLKNTDYSSSSFYGTISWFITGEDRNYSKSKSCFGIITPRRSFGEDGWGAFEIAVRYSHSNFNDDDLNGGELNNINIGLNWYLNYRLKVAFNYIHSDVPEYQGIANLVQMRFQVAI